MVARYRLLNVFTDPGGEFGNALAVFMDGSSFPDEQRRQEVAHELNYSETVFVDDPVRGDLHIFTPQSELPLAGHPLVGSAWLIARELGACQMLRPPAGEVPTFEESGRRFIRGRPEWAPPFELVAYESPDEVDSLDGSPDGRGFAYCWAWADEGAGLVRARCFVPAEGIHEDEATGSAALLLAAHIGRQVQIRQGRGSLLHARPGPDGTCEVGGHVLDLGDRSHG